MLSLSGRLGISADARAHRYSEVNETRDVLTLAKNIIEGLDFENLTYKDETLLVRLVNEELKNTPHFEKLDNLEDLWCKNHISNIEYKEGLLKILSE